MRIETTGAHLRAAAGWAHRIVATKPLMPVLGGILITADETATVSATDMDLFGTSRLNAAVITPGRVLVSARLLDGISDTIVKMMSPDTAVSMEDNGTRLTIKAGRAKWILPIMDDVTWPEFPAIGDTVGTVQADALRYALACVIPAMASGKAEAALQTVIFAPGEQLTLVTTDRSRLAVAEVDWIPKAANVGDLLAPSELLRPMMDSLKTAGEVVLSTNGSNLTLECGPARITGRLQAATRQWRSVSLDPDDFGLAFVADTAKLLSAVAGAAVVCEGEEAIQVTFGPDGLLVRPEKNKADTGAEVPDDLLVTSDSPVTFMLTPRYLTDALSGAGSTAVEVRMPEVSVNRLLIRPAVVDDDGGYEPQPGYRHMIGARAGGSR